MEQNWILLDMHMHSNYSKYKDNNRVKETTIIYIILSMGYNLIE